MTRDLPLRPDRRRFLAAAGAAALVAPLSRLLGRDAAAFTGDGVARRVIFFYFSDGVPARSQDGEPSLWHPTGSEHSFALPEVLSPLAPYRDACVFFSGLTMGATDSGSHPGGAKKLLTAVDHGNGVSIDQRLAATAGADRPFRHLYLGVMANQNGASGDKHISYLAPGTTVPPDDDPAHAFGRLFDVPLPPPDPGGGGTPPPLASILDVAKADLDDLRARLGPVERSKLDIHLDALREVEDRVTGGGGGGGGGPAPSCDEPGLGPVGPLYEPESFPALVRAQIDVMVQAMACGLTRVGVLQCSHHTSDLIMSRFPGTPMYDPASDMRSHQASHYGPRHDASRREFAHYVAQRRWFVEQLAYLLGRLAALPEGDGSMLDYSLVLLCTEVSDGNTHSHDDMPFVLAGRGGGAVATGRLLAFAQQRHAGLLAAIARAMGDDLTGFGQHGDGPLPGLLG